ncbi:MAG: hypothetical protein JNM10_20160 [Planctomycetia bacterium]|nr:hypothetical protein [Planctomycetia bacterium]
MAVASWEDARVDVAGRTESVPPVASRDPSRWADVGLATVGWFLLVFGVGLALTRAVRWVGGEPLDVAALPMAAHFALRGLLLLIDVRRHAVVFLLVVLAAVTETVLQRGPAALGDLAFWVLVPLLRGLVPTSARDRR